MIEHVLMSVRSINLREELAGRFTEPQLTVGVYSPVMLHALYHALIALTRGETEADAGLLVGHHLAETPAVTWQFAFFQPELAPALDLSLPTTLIYGFGASASFVLWIEAVATDPSHPPAEMHRVTWSYDPDVLRSMFSLIEAHLDADARRYLQMYQRRFPLRAPPLLAVQQFTNSLVGAFGSGLADSVLAHQTLQSQLQWREDMVRMVVHDVRAPLHTLMISIKNLLARELPAEMRRELLEVANDTTGTLHNLCDSLLEITRLETGRWPLHLEPVDLVGVARNLCRSFELAASHEQAPIAIDACAPTLPLTVDRLLLERILVNLLSNAIKYTPSAGRIRLTIDRVDDERNVSIAVHDTGMGISPEALPHIFDRFFQARSDDRRDGIGFGLYFARLAVQALGGVIYAASTPGVGSTFTIVLPLTPDSAGSH